MAAARRWLAMTRLLWDALGDVPDRRGRQGRQYELRSVLGIALAAMLAGANDLRAIWRWGRRLRPEALRLFGIESGRSPCHASYHYFFQALDADALAATLGRYARGEATGGHIALDGKTLRGSRPLDAAPLHVLSAFATELAGGDRRSRRAARGERDYGGADAAQGIAPGGCDRHRRCDLRPARDLPPCA